MYSISMEDTPLVSMAKACKILRKSIHTFLQYFQYFATIASFIILPFSMSVLISQALIPRSFTIFPAVHRRLNLLFAAATATFPTSTHFFPLLSLKLSQTITSSIITLPFTLSFLLIAKSSIIHFFTTKLYHSNSNNINYVNNNNFHNNNSFMNLYNPILSTHICNSFIIFASNATCFSLLFLAFNFLEGFHLNSPKWVLVLSSFGAIFYSIILANTLVISNLALILSGIEKIGGFLSILKACVLIRGKSSTALALAVPINLGLAAVEALFHFRIIAAPQVASRGGYSVWIVALEGVLIAYIYSIILVLDVIMNCMFYQSCKDGYVGRNDCDLLVEDDCFYDCDVEKLKKLEEFV